MYGRLGIRHRLGLRGVAMLFCSYIWILIGIGVLDGMPSQEMIGAYHFGIPSILQGYLWIIAGVVAIWSAWFSKLDTFALCLLGIPSFIRFSSYLGSWLMSSDSVPGDGDPLAWYPTAYCAALLGLVIFAAASTRTLEPERQESGE